MKKSKPIISLAVALATMLTVFSSFSVNAASPKLSKTKKSLFVGNSFTLTLKNVSKKFSWITSNKNVAKIVSVNSKKHSVKIKGIAKGKATITAKVGKTKYTCKVTVKEKPNDTSDASQEQAPIKEYKVATYLSTSSMEESLNKYAEEGWIVKSITSYVKYNKVYFCVILERDKQT